jgi:hypothetical protein
MQAESVIVAEAREAEKQQQQRISWQEPFTSRT